MAVRTQDLALQPGEVIDAYPVFLAADRYQNILALEHLHLLKASSADQLINLTLAAPV